LKGLAGIDNDRNIKLWKRVEDIYEISKKDEEDNHEEEGNTILSIFNKTIKSLKACC
jgi:hypothetical protein